ncbi:glutathione S-transferase [Aquicoccus sp. SCR17]|nr:glutathione S-transferase [Carideicomes alvinocaridis]
MQLIYSGASPFVRKVRVALIETGLDAEVEKRPVKTTALESAPEAVAANPLGKIPALTRDDGPAIYDSRVITRYLDARAGAGLYPEKRLWEVLTLEATADGIMEAGVLMVYEHRLRAEGERSETWREAQWDKATRAIKAVNDRWMSHLAGPLDMGQVALGCALGYLDFRLGDRDWRRGNEALAEWYARFSQRESMASTAPAD